MYFDLNPAGVQDYSAQNPSDNYYTFKMNPCTELTTIPVGDAICKSGTFSCQVSKASGTPAYLVANAITSLTYDAPSASLTLRLTGGDYCPGNQKYREAIIVFKCGTTLGAPVYRSEVTCAYTFDWTSSAACPLDKAPGGGGGGGSGGLSIGSILSIVFFCSVFIYLAAGATYNYKVKELRGVELVPNLEFWQGLPSLVKDGLGFTKDKINGALNKS